MSSRKLVFLGWDAADWALMHPLLDSGEMPNLQRLIESGVSGSLATMEPALSPMLWNSIVTGKTADQHGILGFLEPDPVTGGARISSSTSRRAKALWNILHQQGLRPHVVNWFASHPAEPIRGVCVSNAFCSMSQSVPNSSVHPAELAEELAAFRVTPADLRPADMSLFIPDLVKLHREGKNPAEDKRIQRLARFLAEGFTAHSAVTWILETQEWDFVAVYLDTIDHCGHLFMQYHPPQMDGVSDEDFETFRYVMNGVYKMHDLMLGRIVQLAGDDATFLIASDHGFHSDHLRPRSHAGIEFEDALQWHRKHGIFCLSGPGIRRDELVHGATLLDLTPTVLALFGIPAGSDMPGRVLTEAFEEAPELERIPSWETVEGDAGTHPTDLQQDPWDAAEAMAQLVALGYVEEPSKDVSERRELAIWHQKLNLARVHLAGSQPSLAIPLLEEAIALRGSQPGVLGLLAQAYFRTHALDKANEVVHQILADNPGSGFARLMRANVARQNGDHEAALNFLLEAEEASQNHPEFQIRLGQSHLRLRRTGDTERHFRRAIELDPRSAAAWRALAVLFLVTRRPKEAADAALQATGLDYSNAVGHFVLGLALARTRRYEDARLALQLAVRFAPGMQRAHRALAMVYARLGDLDAARVHRDALLRLREMAKAARG